jgi:hypothetical protein
MTDILAPATGPLIYDGIERPYRVEDYIARDHNKRPYILVADGRGGLTGERTTYTRVTTFIKGIDDKRNLEDWILRQTLKGYTLSPSVYSARLAVVFGAQDEKARMNELIEEMQTFARMSEKALLGTAIHALTERHDLNIPTPIFPDPYRPHLQEWIRLTAPWQPFTPDEIERFVVNDDLKTAGTGDRRGQLRRPCRKCGGRWTMIDLKTGRVDDFTQREAEMQLATYARSMAYDPNTGLRTPLMMCVCEGYIVHIPSETGRGRLLRFDLERGWELCRTLMPAIREARRYRPKPTEVDPLALAIADAETTEDLRIIWERATGWTPIHTEAARARRLELEALSTNGGTA